MKQPVEIDDFVNQMTDRTRFDHSLCWWVCFGVVLCWTVILQGGGFYISGGSTTLSNCVVSSNSAVSDDPVGWSLFFESVG